MQDREDSWRNEWGCAMMYMQEWGWGGAHRGTEGRARELAQSQGSGRGEGILLTFSSACFNLMLSLKEPKFINGEEGGRSGWGRGVRAKEEGGSVV